MSEAPASVEVLTQRLFPERQQTRYDQVVVEAPLQIRVNDADWVVTMRTPGQDPDLAFGLLLSEGIIERRSDVVECVVSADPERPNCIDVVLAPGVQAPQPSRSMFASSACGVCGATAIESLERRFPRVAQTIRLPDALLAAAPDALRAEQKVFQLTGGIHGAALWRPPDSGPWASAEDVGRHNAVDKVIGAALRAGQSTTPGWVLAVTSRVGFEIAAKAWAAGVEVLVAVGAPSDLAIRVCEDAEITLCGFATGERLNVYSHPGRINPRP
jgi:FdhD protein